MLLFLFGIGITLLLPVRVSARTFSCKSGSFSTTGIANLDITAHELQLTPENCCLKGGIWSNNKAILSQPFDFSGQGYLVAYNDHGADGLCFVLHDAPPEDHIAAYTNDNGRHNSTSLVIHPVLINNIKYF